MKGIAHNTHSQISMVKAIVVVPMSVYVCRKIMGRNSL